MDQSMAALPGPSAGPMDYDPSPMSLLGPDFDYGAFLQEEDVDVDLDVDTDYLAEESSTSNNTNTAAEASTSNALVPGSGSQSLSQSQSQSRLLAQRPRPDGASPGTSPTSAAHLRQKLERRGHTKSRRGCFNCKRRRIKCQETRPACGHCVKTGLNCEYPSMPVVVHQPQHQIPLFSLQDMRFFQHFLFQCYPHHPLGAEGIWRHEIICLSQNYDYLMHAILGFAASELISEDPSLVAAAMTHRLKAIKAVKKCLAEAPRANTFEEGNALMATCFALTFQSVLLEDGMADYLTFIRGIVIIAIQMYIKGAKMLFGNFMGEHAHEVLRPHMEKLPLVEKSWTDAAVAAIKNLGPLCRGREVEEKYYEMILDMAEKLYVSSWEAYHALTKQYGWWMMLPHDKFQRLINPSNQVSLLLATHWIALKQIMAIITDVQEMQGWGSTHSGRAAEGDMTNGIAKWLKHLNRTVDQEHVAFNQWPMWVEAQLEQNPGYFGKRTGRPRF